MTTKQTVFGMPKDTSGGRSFDWLVGALLLFFVAIRFFHFRNDVIDGPHEWRQLDTWHYALGFYNEGMNIFRPSVAWYGAHKTAILEFPLHEWLTALAFHVTGPQVYVARLVTLLFFVGSAVYLFFAVRLLTTARTAALTTLFYVSAPLGILYSRAVHVDTSALCFAHMLLFHALRWNRDGRSADLLLAIMGGVLVALIKVPYGFYLAAPIVAHAVSIGVRGERRDALAGVGVVVVAVFLSWQAYVNRVNTEVPVLPHIGSLSHRYDWYFGNLEQRLDLANWIDIAKILIIEVGSVALIPLAIVGLFAARGPSSRVLVCWAIGGGIYLVIFFRLVFAHNYYSTPFLAVVAFAAAVGFERVVGVVSKFSVSRKVVELAGVAALATVSLVAAEWLTPRVSFSSSVGPYYVVNQVAVDVAKIIEGNTNPDDLVLMSDAHSDFDSPLYLVQAKRLGWNVKHENLNASTIEALKKVGVRWVIALVAQGHASTEMAQLLRCYSVKEVTVPSHDQMRVLVMGVR